MRLTDPLNERQVAVLRWIADGCLRDVMKGHSHKVTARALQERRLVEIRKQNGSWSAAITEAGSYYLAHGSFPPKSGRATRAMPTSTKARSVQSKTSSSQSAGTPAAADTLPPARSAKPPKLSPTEQLVADVVAAGGLLKRSSEDRRGGRDDAEDLVRAANRHGKTPAGTRLVHEIVYESTSWLGPRSDLFKLVEGPAGTDAPLLPVPVPEQVDRYHPAVSAPRKSKHQADGAVQVRKLRILHAVAVEAERRGFTVTRHVPKPASDDGRRPVAWHLLLAAQGEIVPLRIEEEDDRVEHVPTPRELKEHERRPWIRIPSHDVVPSGRLRIEIGGSSVSERRSFWADRKSWLLEDKLPEVLREVAVRADELRLRRQAKARAEAEYREAVEYEERLAQARAAEAHRAKVLDEQLAGWRVAQELRGYAGAISQRIAAAQAKGHARSQAVVQARRWLEWINERADQHDPLLTLPWWPAAPDLPQYELRKFMNQVAEPREMCYQPETY